MCQYVWMPCRYKCGRAAGIKMTYQQVGNCDLCGIPQHANCWKFPKVDIKIDLNEPCPECLADGEWFVANKIWSEKLLAWFWDEELLARSRPIGWTGRKMYAACRYS